MPGGGGLQFRGRELLTAASCDDSELIAEFFYASRKVSDDNIRNLLGQMPCDEVVANIRAEWARRDAVFAFCQNGQQKTTERTGSSLAELAEHSREVVRFAPTSTDPRVDAYSARDEVQTRLQTNWMAQEAVTEEIIRDSTRQAVQDKCGFLKW